MSASSKKKLRKELNAASLTERQLQEKNEAKKLKRNTIIFVVVIALVAVAFLGLLVYRWIDGSGIILKSTNAASIGSTKLNSVELNYYYVDAVQEAYSEWNESASSYAESIGLDTDEIIKNLYNVDVTKPLSEQQTAEGSSWADYFLDEAMNAAQEDYAMAAAAKAAGYTLSEEDKASLSNMRSNLETFSMLYGFTGTKSYLRAMYGTGADEDSFMEYQERIMLADSYAASYESDMSEITYDRADIDAKDAESTLEYNGYDYAYYYMSYEKFMHIEEVEAPETEEETTEETVEETTKETAEETVEETTEETAEETVGETVEVTVAETTEAIEETVEEVTEAIEDTEEEEHVHTEEEKDTARAAAKETADQLATAGSIEELDALIGALSFNADTETVSTKGDNAFASSIPASIKDWVIDESRQAGDITVIANETTANDDNGDEVTVVNGYYVVYYTATNDNKTPMANVRHLLVKFAETEGEDSEPTEEIKAEAKAKADELLTQWQEGDATEESFIALVQEHSEDGNAAEGGLYENINPGTSFVTPFLDWCLDESREVGNVEIVETEYGYHIMYFSSYSEFTYRDELVMQDLREADLASWRTSQLEMFPIQLLNTKYLPLDMTLAG